MTTPIIGYLFDGKFVKEIIPEQEPSAIIVYDPEYVEKLQLYYNQISTMIIELKIDKDDIMNKFRF